MRSNESGSCVVCSASQAAVTIGGSCVAMVVTVFVPALQSASAGGGAVCDTVTLGVVMPVHFVQITDTHVVTADSEESAILREFESTLHEVAGDRLGAVQPVHKPILSCDAEAFLHQGISIDSRGGICLGEARRDHEICLEERPDDAM